MLRIAVCIGCLFFLTVLPAQRNASADTVQVYRFISLSKQKCEEGDKDSAAWYSKKAAELAGVTGDASAIADAYIQEGWLREKIQHFEKAISFYQQALQAAENIKGEEGKTLKARIASRIGVKYDYLLQWDKAISYHQEALRLSEEIKDTIGIIRSCVNLQTVYFSMQENTRAMQHIRKGYDLAKRTGDPEAIGYTALNISDNYVRIGKRDSSAYFIHEAIACWTKLNRQDMLAHCFSNLGENLVAEAKYAEGISTILMANDLKEKNNMKRELASGYITLGIAYHKSGKSTTGEQWLEKGIRLADSVGSTDEYGAGLQALADLKRQEGNWQQAAHWQARLLKYNDSIYSDARRRAIAVTEVEYQVQGKNREIAYLREKEAGNRRTIWLISVCLLMALVLLGLLFASYRMRKTFFAQQEKLEKEEQEKATLGKKLEEEALQKLMLEHKLSEERSLREKQETERQLEEEKYKNERLRVEIDHKQREMATIVLHTANKNDLLIQIREMLVSIAPESDKGPLHKPVKDILRLLNQELNDNYNWDAVKLHFENVHPDFFNKLINVSPELSNTELKHCAYIKMGLSTKDVANFMNINSDSVKISRYRIKKKLQLLQEEDLVTYLQTI